MLSAVKCVIFSVFIQGLTVLLKERCFLCCCLTIPDLKCIQAKHKLSHMHTTASGSSIVWLPGNCRRGVVARAVWEGGR